MTVSVYEDNPAIDYTSTFMVFAPMSAAVTGMDPSARTDIAFAPMSLYVGEYDWSGVDISFAPMQAESLGVDFSLTAPEFYTAFAPTFSGPVPVIAESVEHQFTFDGEVTDSAGSGTVTIVAMSRMYRVRLV
jgi:hypothetical protein